MAETPTTICNQALARVGVKPIDSFENDQTKVARDCRTLFHPARRKTLELAYWNHAKKTAQLTVNSSVTPTFWTYAFTPPTDVIRYISVHPSDDPNASVEYEFDNNATYGKLIVTDSNQLYVKYIFDNTDITEASEGFRDTLSFVLARDLCASVEKSVTEVGLTDAAFRRVLSIAKGVDGAQKYPQKLADGDWIKSRTGLNTDRTIINS